MWIGIPSLGSGILGDWLAFTYAKLPPPNEHLSSYLEENYPGGIEGAYVVGDAPGNVSQEAYNVLSKAYDLATTILGLDTDKVTEGMTTGTVTVLEAAQQFINQSIVPAKAGYYYITNTVYPSQGAYVEGSEVWHDSIDVNAELSVDQSKFIWELIPAGTYGETPTFYVRNLRTGTYAGAGVSGTVPLVEEPVEYLIRTRLSLVGESEGFALSSVNYPSRSWNRNGDNQRSTTVFWQAMGNDCINSYWYLTPVDLEESFIDEIAQAQLNEKLAALKREAQGAIASATHCVSPATADGLFPNALGEGADEYRADGILVSDDLIRTNAPEPNENLLNSFTSKLVDGQNDTHFHSAWSYANTHNQNPVLDIDLQGEYNALTAKIETRMTSWEPIWGKPKTIVYYGANLASSLLPKTDDPAKAGVANYEGWTELGTTTIEDYPYANAEGVDNIVALADLPFGDNNYRYLRLRFVDNDCNESHVTKITNGWVFVGIAELRLYGATVDPASPIKKVKAATLAELKAQIASAQARLAAGFATQAQIDALQAALDAFLAELNVVTGAGSVSSTQAAAENVAIYDLAGRRVGKAAKGLYVVDGKKVIMK